MLQPIILAGGSGQRLWPLSRKSTPKPFLPLCENTTRTLYQQTLERISSCKNSLPPIIICQEEHRFLAGEQARSCGITIASIILEPCQKNTAPAALLSCLYALNNIPEANNIIILPADHIFSSSTKFNEAIDKATSVANQNKIVTLGITPQYPETGYGYIKFGDSISETGAHKIISFIEKPNLKIANEIYKQPEYLWNAGIFISPIRTFIDEFEKFDANTIAACNSAIENCLTDHDFIRPAFEDFTKCQNISIDNGLMEKTNLGAVVPFASSWEDLGHWQSMWAHHEKDTSNNVAIGKVISINSKNNYIHAQSRLVATQGIESLIIVETEDAILITTRDEAKNLKEVVSKVQAKYPEQVLTHKRVERPWGFFESILLANNYQVKRLSILAHSSISLQLHYHREEHWVIVSGKAKVIRGNETLYLKKGQSTHIPVQTKHRLENIGDEVLEIIEVQTGAYLGEDDIVRFDDQYGRVKKGQTANVE